MDTLPVFTAGSEATGDTTEVVGFSKPLHRLMRADPKSIGVAMMILGGSQLITGIPMMLDIMGNNAVYGGLWLGTVFVICGILYFLSGSSPSKKLNQVSCMEGIWLLHCFVGGVILIVMTAFSRAALRSTKTQATVIMYNRPSA
nr:uncharacterized protein LOC111852831 isoform X2 [Paramormyrops kingsleyae]